MPINSFLYPGAKVTLAYEVANSCRFNDGDSAAMSKSSTTLTNDKKFTISAWCKRGALSGSGQFPIFGHISDSNNANKNCQIGFYNDALYMAYVDGGSVTVNKVTNALYRDPSAWMHVMVAVDSTQGTAANRNRFYVNGTEVTSFSTDTNSGSDETFLATSCTITVGKYSNTAGTASYFDGYLAEVVYIDGLQLTPSSFGEFDEDSPTIFKPIDVSGLTFGNNGFYLDFEASANLGNDANGGTDLTEANLAATDSSTDTPTNSFCTLNPLDNYYPASTFSEGNCKIATNASNQTFNTGTIGLSTGKWYWEAYLTTAGGEESIGITDIVSTGTGIYGGKTANSYSFKGNNGDIRNNDSNASYGNAYAQDVVIGVALNLDDNEIKFYKDGTVENSGTAHSITAPASTSTGLYFPMFGDVDTDSVVWSVNFGGSPAFTVSSGNADANGYGNFEYAVPSGYLALCTKNLGSDGG